MLISVQVNIPISESVEANFIFLLFRNFSEKNHFDVVIENFSLAYLLGAIFVIDLGLNGKFVSITLCMVSVINLPPGYLLA
ncbi:MAG: hypothetical protein ABI778_00400 [Ignavibacteriota bacterium]